MSFHFIYKSLAHPENNGYVAPFTIKERLMHVAEARRQLGSKIPWICDGMENAVSHQLGGSPNSEYIVDAENKVVVSRRWSDPDLLRGDLEKLVGAVEPPTRASDLGYLSRVVPAKEAARGVLPRVKVPDGVTALKLTPISGKDGKPHYAKLRAESNVVHSRDGTGTLYLGLTLDPLYHVHWNNLAEPLRFAITEVEGVKLASLKGVAKTPAVDADVDPREFLIRVSDFHPGARCVLTVHYFACNDEEGWCLPVEQSYEILFERDRFGGSRRSAGGRRPGMGRR